jgi:phosphoribosylformylglycinamidine synthase
MRTAKTLILRAAGTNCDYETGVAFRLAGSETELVHMNRLLRGERRLEDYQILAIPGGFTYGDDVSAGKILANELRDQLAEEVQRFIQAGKLIIGICNGFQALVKARWLPGLPSGDVMPQATLFNNDSGRFQCEWVRLRVEDGGLCVFTKGMQGKVLEMPIAHGEGKFIPQDESVLRHLKHNHQIVFRYVDKNGQPTPEGNPNGSIDNIAGICDPTGRVLALMPHPERHIFPTQHPRWTREGPRTEGDGLIMFRNAVEYAARL